MVIYLSTTSLNAKNLSIEGGDGLVAARHLFHYGYKPTVYYPKKTSNEIYEVALHRTVNVQATNDKFSVSQPN